MISIRCGKGLGDALYLQSVVRYFVGKGEKIEACCNWPDVFIPLKGKVEVSPFRRERINRLAHYSNRKTIFSTDMFEDCCINAGIKEPVEMKLDWTILNDRLIREIQEKAEGRPIVLIQLPRAPMGRTDGFGIELLPDCAVVQRTIDIIGDSALTVQIGAGEPIFNFSGIAVDLANKTSVPDVIDIACVSQGMIGYCSFMVPLGESFSKPSFFVWSSKGLKSDNEFVRTVTPTKVLHRKSSRYVIDDCADAELAEAVDAFRQQTASAAGV